MTTIAMLFLLIAGGAPPQNGDPSPTKRAVRAIRVSQSVVVDARLDEPFWLEAERVTDFVQRDPNEGAAPSESTVVYVAYDDAAMYIAARLYDSAPDSIVARLGRRDVGTSSDRFTLFVDSYHDRRSGFYFGVNAAGALSDGILYNDDWDDNSWDGVWEGKAAIDARGWVVELRIPYSQLRFRQADVQVWGINFRREIARKNEVDFYAPRPKNASGFVSRFADLVGIERITPPRRLELLPYINTRAAYTEAGIGNPFNDGSRYTPAMGLDIRAGIGSNFTLNATVNPDFGQVEVDPAVVNLSDVETFFQEKRPFFIEGSSIFEFGFGGASNYWGFNWRGPSMFYSRRMGRAPQGGTRGNVDHVDRPEGVNILGALKFTGKVAGNWNVGTLAAVTAREYADLDSAGRRFRQEIEPLTSYSVFRAQREFPEGRQGLGTMLTATVRDFDDRALRDQTASGAYVAGLDGWTFLDKDKEWVVTGWVAGSHVRGTAARITQVQQSPVHYFQRPDYEQASVDSNATSLTGWAARFHLNKQKGDWFSNSALGLISPGYETNDLGFMTRTGLINMHVGGGHAWRKPGKVLREAQVMGALFQSYNWDRDVTWRGVWGDVWVRFLNYWSVEFGSAYNPATLNDTRTRGGPLTRNDPGFETFLWMSTDSRKRVVFSTNGGRYYQNASDYDAWAGFDLEYRPASNLSLSIGPNFNWSKEPGQRITAYDDTTANATFDRRYVFADLHYHEVSAGIRLNWTFAPTLSLQLYAQPLIAAGEYDRYKALARPRSFEFDVYGDGGSTIADSTTFYLIDADGPGPSPGQRINKDDSNRSDFTSHSLRGSAVLRWEYLPGSTLYLVWTQSRDGGDTDGRFRFGRSMNRLLDGTPDNIFMVKVSYWWNP